MSARTRKKTAAKRKRAGKPAKAGRARASTRGVSEGDVRGCAMALPGAEEGSSYGTPAWRVRGKLFARIHQSGDALVVRVDLDDRDVAMAADPKTYFITDHYTGYPMMLVHPGHVTRAGLAASIEESWRRVATKRLVDELDAAK